MSGDSALSVVDVHKSHAGAPPTPTLVALSLEVPRGALVAVLGRSGAGKTTLLRVLSGLDRFERGSITVRAAAGGRELTVRGGEPTDALHGAVGLVFQSLELFPHRSVLDNCTLAPMHVRGLPRADAEARARELLAQLEIDDKRALFPEALSGGQRQRVAIARALMMEPAVLLYDEPTSALDPALKLEVQRTLQRVGERITQIVVTHDERLAGEIATHRYLLEGGALRPLTPA